MKTTICLACLSVLCGTLYAASATIDLRTPSVPRRGLAVQAEPEGSCLRTASFPAGAAASAPLSVGDELNFLLFDGVEISVRLAKRMESPLGGEAFLGEVSGYDGAKNAVVLPPGKWRDAAGTVREGPAKVTVDAPLGRPPYFELVR